jgi:hypothetical protein
MTQEEIRKQHEQQLQNNITLDYTKWSFERRRRGLSTDHDLWQKERDYVMREQFTHNAETRRKYLAGLQEKRDVEARADERAIDAELLPKKLRLKRQWLADNPTFSENDFETKAWVHLRQNLVEERTDAAREAELKRQLSTFRY